MRRELLVPFALLAAAVYLWVVASNFRGGVGRYEVLGPSFFPKLLLGALVVVCIMQLSQVLLRPRRIDSGVRATKIHWRLLITALAITLAYVASLETLGFLAATPIFQVLLLVFVFKIRDWRRLVSVPAGLTVLFAFIFIGLMNVPLPRGRWVIGELSRLIY